MTKQLHALPDLENTQRSKYVSTSVPKYSAAQRKAAAAAAYLAPSEIPAPPRGMEAGGHVTTVEPHKGRSVPPGRARREDSRLADLGDDLNTPRVNHEDRTKAEAAVLPPIDALAPIADAEENQDGQASPQAEPKTTLKLPVASRYQLYSIGLTYNTTAGKDKKDKRSKKKPQTYREINSRRMKMKGGSYREEVPDIPGATKTSPDQQFSIRKKIDQYRNWHEEQYRQKIKDLKTDDEKEKQAEILKIAALKNKAKKPTIKMAHRSTSSDHLPRLPIKADHNVPSALAKVEEDVVSQHDIPVKIESPTGKENEPKVSTDREQRVSSGKTWRTWRDVNDSYAYTDVKQYIKDNELMDEEKEKYINEWIEQVADTYSANGDTKSQVTLRSGRDA